MSTLDLVLGAFALAWISGHEPEALRWANRAAELLAQERQEGRL